MQNEVTVKDKAEVVNFNKDQIDLLKRTICKGSTDDEFKLFQHVCNRSGLDPFARQIFAVMRYDSKLGKEVMSIQTSIDGFRLIAQRSGQYAGQLGPFWCDEKGEWKDCWLDHANLPYAAKVGVLRHDFKEPCWAVARFDAYVQKYKSNKTGKWETSMMWTKMSDLMIAKCAEALALRKAFPQELSGLYTNDEMAQAAVETEVKEVNKEEQVAKPVTQYQLKNLVELTNKKQINKDQMTELLKMAFNVDNSKNLTDGQFMELYTQLSNGGLDGAKAHFVKGPA